MAYTRKTWKTGGWKSSTNSTRKTNRTHTNRTNSTSSSTSSQWTPSASYSPAKFTQCRKQVAAKISSFRTLNQQYSGNGKVTAFSPTTANRWINLVNNGCCVYKFSNTDFNRYFGKYFTTGSVSTSPTTVQKQLKKQFGAGIKAVTMGKGNNWLVAANQKINARPFSTYTWK